MAFSSSIRRFRKLLRFSTSVPCFSTYSLAHPRPHPPSKGSSMALQRTNWRFREQQFFPGVPFSSQSVDAGQGPSSIDYRSVLSEEEFHKLADETIQNLQEKIEEFGDELQMDGFDVDYGNQVLTVKLGRLGTYVINKQTPNRQIWLSSPVSGPARFDWDNAVQAWIYRRTKVKLLDLLEGELEQLCGKPIVLV